VSEAGGWFCLPCLGLLVCRQVGCLLGVCVFSSPLDTASYSRALSFQALAHLTCCILDALLASPRLASPRLASPCLATSHPIPSHPRNAEQRPNDGPTKDGALVGQHDADIPVAKLAEDNWATALAWRQHQQTATNSTSPVIYGDDGQGHEASSTDRWRSARATARQARHINSSGDGAAMAAGAVAAYRNSSQSVSSRSPEGRGDRVGGGSGGVGRGRGGWEQPVVVVIGERSRQSSTNERMSDGEEDLTTTAMVLPGRQSGGFSL